MDVNHIDLEASDKQADKQPNQSNHQNHTKNNRKKSIVLNLKSGVVNSTALEDFSNFSTRFSESIVVDSQRERIRKIIVYIGIPFGCLCFVALGLILSQLFGSRTCEQRKQRGVCVTENCIRTASTLLSAMNRSADPCDNFFQYACGAWNKKNVIPEDKSSFSTFEVLADQQQLILRELLQDAVNVADNEATIKAKDFYKSCINTTQIRIVGDASLKALLKSLGGWPVLESEWKKPTESIEQLMGRIRGHFNEQPIITVLVGPDDKNSSINVLQFDQLALALPSRDYYLKSSSEAELRAYHRYMTEIAIMLGANSEKAQIEMNDVINFEIALANISMAEIDRHDTSSVYLKITLQKLSLHVPELNWLEFVQAVFEPNVKIDENEQVVIYAMPYLTSLGKLLTKTDRKTIQNYLMWRLVLSLASHFIDDFQKHRIEFQKILLGVQSERSRWSQCVDWTNKKLGMAVGALFIRDNFNSESKESALEMIHSIRDAFNELLDENDWMDNETRAVAKEKANAINERVGYPEILTNKTELEYEYKSLLIEEKNFFANLLHIVKWDADKSAQLLRKPVEKHKWSTEPAVVNAFYNPNRNDIVFPAGVLQPLFYSKNFPKSLNYGGIGVVIGHEITHGFDDKGRQYDKDGNLKQWWNNSTINAFRDRAQCIIDQYSRYKISEVGLYMNGKMTQSENIADNGGLKQAFRAYKKWVDTLGYEDDLPGLGLTHDQLFFLNYAQIWCGSMRPEDALSKLRSSVHSPGAIRVFGPLSNSKEFAEAFSCLPGSLMNPTNKCSVW